jgi:hypothetical protein
MKEYIGFLTVSDYCRQNKIKPPQLMVHIYKGEVDARKVDKHWYIPENQPFLIIKNPTEYPIGETRKKVRELADQFLNATSLAKYLGVSRARVGQIAKIDNIQKLQLHPAPRIECPICHNIFVKRSKHQETCSKICHRELIKQRRESKKVIRICLTCGKEFKISPRLIKPKRGSPANYCSRKCSGVMVGTKYGFAAHPENVINNAHLRKHNYEQIYQIHQETGYGAIRIARLLNISYRSVSPILYKLKIKHGSDFKPTINIRNVKNISSL